MGAFRLRSFTVQPVLLLIIWVAPDNLLLNSDQASGQEFRAARRSEDRLKAVQASGIASEIESPKGGSKVSAWKSGPPRGWAASPRDARTGDLQLVSAMASEDEDDRVITPPKPRVAASPAQKKPGTSPPVPARPRQSAAVSVVEDAPQPPATRPLTATERFKQALAEQRRALEQQSSVPSTGRAGAANGQGTGSSPGALKSTGPLGLSEPLRSDLDSDDPLKREKAERFLRLRSQLMQLKSRIQQSDTPAEFQQDPDAEQAAADSPSSGTPPSGSAAVDDEEETAADPDLSLGAENSGNPAGSGLSPNAASPVTEDAVPPVPSAVDSASSEDAGQSLKNPEEKSLPGETPLDPADHSKAPEKAVVDGPIDRVGLANNLYAVGEYRLAMDMYENASAGDLSAQQQIWAEYQTANCLRRLGRNGEASNRYRKLGGKAEAGWLSEQSRWWVEVLEQVRQLEKSLESDATSPFDSAANRTPDSAAATTAAATSAVARPPVLYFSGQPAEVTETAKRGQAAEPSGSSPTLLKELTDGERPE